MRGRCLCRIRRAELGAFVALAVGVMFVDTSSVSPGSPYPDHGAGHVMAAEVCGGFRLLEDSAQKDGLGAARLLNGDDAARRILEEVAAEVGVITSTILLRESLDVRTRIAVACENKNPDGTFNRYILYDPVVLNLLAEQVEGGWFEKAIFAHEIGHVLKNHNLLQEKSVTCAEVLNLNEKNGRIRADMEIEADEVAGEILAKLGASLSDAKASFRRISTDDPNDGCYPSRSERLAAVERGWDRIARRIAGSDDYERGSLALERQQWDLAITEFSRAIEKNPKYVEAFNRRGIAYWGKRNGTAAIDDFTKAIQIASDFHLPYYNRAVVLSTIGRMDEAISDYSQVVTLRPTATRAYIERGRIHRMKKANDKAIADFTTAVERKPEDPRGWSNRGGVYRQAGKCENAIPDLTTAIRLDPRDSDAYFNRAICYRKSGEISKANADSAMVQKINAR